MLLFFICLGRGTLIKKVPERRNEMTFNDVAKKYYEELQELKFEIIETQRLGWIAIRTDYKKYMDPVKQFTTPEELERYIVDQIEVEKLDQ